MQITMPWSQILNLTRDHHHFFALFPQNHLIIHHHHSKTSLLPPNSYEAQYTVNTSVSVNQSCLSNVNEHSSQRLLKSLLSNHLHSYLMIERQCHHSLSDMSDLLLFCMMTIKSYSELTSISVLMLSSS